MLTAERKSHNHHEAWFHHAEAWCVHLYTLSAIVILPDFVVLSLQCQFRIPGSISPFPQVVTNVSFSPIRHVPG